MAKKRAMTSEAASHKKISGHLAEHRFAKLIGGTVNAGSPTDKKDVIDKKHRTHSVKQGRYWQIFLYRRSRLETNTTLRAFGNLANILIECLDAFPSKRSDYLADKEQYKIALQNPMRKLCKELQNDDLRRGFYEKAIFNSNEVNYLSVYDGKVWHVFPSEFVLDYLINLEVTNSKKRNRNQFNAQKVLIKDRVNFGEIEIRTDSQQHYREVKFRIDGGKRLLPNLIEMAKNKSELKLKPKVIVYENAIKTFKPVF